MLQDADGSVQWTRCCRPERARRAAQALTAAREGDTDYSDRHKVLIDCRTVFESFDAMPSTVLLERLKALPESPWADYNNGAGLTPMKLGLLLKEYDITSDNITFKPPVGRMKGFHRAPFADAWQRYCTREEKPASQPYKPYKPYADPQTPSSDNVRLFQSRTA
ncbi:DUF3631 domain-containing protein [Actinoplanes sp. NEAU-A12]|uniref:DUF3631 domain-containing protein n=1 Tax=Actinoplanes sandaracinus TaxID=3045177 RepID=A0ABT6WXB8_9ACTN|nr:DUF3631 domain-containing protein [Actinoplanes sandaracinus]MDI6104382.1 DUF3631 domain-containing protein [Actinoplanes sandaracinus]